MNYNLQQKNKNEFNNYLILTSIKLLNLCGFKYYLPKVPKNHLVKYIEYQMYLQKELEKKNISNYYTSKNKYYMDNIKTNIILNDIKYLKI